MLPEIDNDQLGGAVTETKSTNGYIEGVVTTLKSEVYGLNGQVIDTEQAEVYGPHRTGADPEKSNDDNSQFSIDSSQDTRKITHQHSAFGSRLVQLRKLKRAA